MEEGGRRGHAILFAIVRDTGWLIHIATIFVRLLSLKLLKASMELL